MQGPGIECGLSIGFDAFLLSFSTNRMLLFTVSLCLCPPGQNSGISIFELIQGRSSTINSCDKRAVRPLMEGPQSSERVSRQETHRDTKTDSKAEAPCLTLTLASFLLVIISCGPRSKLAPQTAFRFFVGNAP